LNIGFLTECVLIPDQIDACEKFEEGIARWWVLGLTIAGVQHIQ
jgi:hypothetical protein